MTANSAQGPSQTTFLFLTRAVFFESASNTEAENKGVDAPFTSRSLFTRACALCFVLVFVQR